MKTLVAVLMVSTLLWGGQVQADGHCPETLSFEKRRLNSGDTENLCQTYLGKVVLIVNTASRCGFTHQYDGLEALYARYREHGFVVLGFPSNDFGGQEPGTEAQIQSFCRLTYAVSFPMFEKTHAAQRDASPIYRTLGDLAGEYPSWNFHKYLLDRDGRLVKSFSTPTAPQSDEMVEAIEALL